MATFEHIILCAAVTLLYLNAGVHGNESNFEGDSIRNEKECAYQGGICVMKDDCPEDYLTAVKGLCPTQQHRGVECCYSLPLSAKTCKSRGGECVAKNECGNAPTVRAECADGQTCCVFV